MKKVNNYIAHISCLTLFSVFVSACTKTTEVTSKIVLGSSSANLQTAPIIVAMQEGFFEAEGLEVEAVNFSSGRRGLEALLGGQVDLAFMSEYPPVLAALQDQEFSVVTELSHYTGNRIISSTDVEFENMQDLEGMKIGTTMGSNTEFFTELLISQANIEAEVVDIDPSAIVPALSRGDIDAGVTFPDFYPLAVETLGDKYREEISSEYTSYSVVAASSEILNEREDDVEKFLKALISAEEFIESNPEAAQTAVIEASQGTLDTEHVKSEWPNHVYRVGLYKDFFNTMVQEAQWVVDKGLINNVNATADSETIRTYIADEPMSTIDPSRVSID